MQSDCIKNMYMFQCTDNVNAVFAFANKKYLGRGIQFAFSKTAFTLSVHWNMYLFLMQSDCIIYKTLTNINKYAKSDNWYGYNDVNNDAQCALSLVLQLSIDLIAIPMMKHIVHYYLNHHDNINCNILHICWYWLMFCIWCNQIAWKTSTCFNVRMM